MGSVPVIKDGSAVRVYSRHGAEYTARLPGMVEAFSKLSARTTILDGELCLIDPKVGAHFYANARIGRGAVGVPRLSRKCGACRGPKEDPAPP